MLKRINQRMGSFFYLRAITHANGYPTGCIVLGYGFVVLAQKLVKVIKPRYGSALRKPLAMNYCKFVKALEKRLEILFLNHDGQYGCAPDRFRCHKLKAHIFKALVSIKSFLNQQFGVSLLKIKLFQIAIDSGVDSQRMPRGVVIQDHPCNTHYTNNARLNDWPIRLCQASASLFRFFKSLASCKTGFCNQFTKERIQHAN
jgi:hypothetical protein